MLKRNYSLIFSLSEVSQITPVGFSLSCPSPFIQMVELHMRVKALSEANQQQAEEIAVWRLASQPAPTFDCTDNQSVTQDPGQALKTEAEVQKPCLGVQSSPEYVTVIREDELVLSCSSCKLQGNMLFSR